MKSVLLTLTGFACGIAAVFIYRDVKAKQERLRQNIIQLIQAQDEYYDPYNAPGYTLHSR